MGAAPGSSVGATNGFSTGEADPFVDVDCGSSSETEAASMDARPLLPRLLRLLLLPAALRVLRPPSLGGEASQSRYRCERRSGRGDRPDCGAAARQLAECAHPAAGRFRLRPPGLDGLVRGQSRRLSVRPGAQSSSRRDDRKRACGGQERGGGERKAGAPLQGVRLVDAGQLVARAAGRRQGGMDARRSQPALRRHLAQA